VRWTSAEGRHALLSMNTSPTRDSISWAKRGALAGAALGAAVICAVAVWSAFGQAYDGFGEVFLTYIEFLGAPFTLLADRAVVDVQRMPGMFVYLTFSVALI